MIEQLQGYAPLKKAKKMEEASYSRPLSIEEKFLVEELYQRNDVQNDGEFFTKAVVNGNVLIALSEIQVAVKEKKLCNWN